MILLLSFFCNGQLPSLAQQPGLVQTLTAEQQGDVRTVAGDLRKAMLAGDERLINQLAARLFEVLGDQAGLPEERAEFWPAPDEPERPPPETLLRFWHSLVEKDRGHFERLGDYGRGLKPGDERPTQMLRGAAYAAAGFLCASAIPALEARRETYLRWAKEACDALVTTQVPSGLFPFPDLRGHHPRFGPAIERLLARYPDAVANGWLVDDHGDGGLQFDNGVVGSMLAEAAAVLNGPRYLDAARRAGDWALSQPVVINWNYNSFSARLLGRLYGATGEERYLEGALKKLRLGVFPGQMSNGRWADGHNAKSVYHAIMLRAMADVYLALPDDHPGRALVRDHLLLGAQNLADEIGSLGVSNVSQSLKLYALLASDRAAEGGLEQFQPVAQLAADRIVAVVLDQSRRPDGTFDPRNCSVDAFAAYLAVRMADEQRPVGSGAGGAGVERPVSATP